MLIAAATARVQRILDGVSSAHITQSGGVWGGHWQSAQWTTMLATTARLSPPSQTVRDRIATVTTFEADRLLTEPVLFWKQWNGTENFPGDTKAEENAWNGAFLILAAAMYPEATNAAEWYQKGLEFSAAAVAMPRDQATGVVHGNAIGDFPGYNINDDGSLENHGYLNPHYTASITELLWGVVSILGHLWYLIPDAVVHNAQSIYRYFDGPLYNGRTIYTPRTGNIYYPEGWANGTWRIDNFLTADVVAHVYELDRDANHPAAYWAELHMADLLAHQARYTSGQTYTPQDDENNYPGREQEVLRHLGFQALAAAALKGAAAFDGRSIPFSGAATALPVQNSGVGLHHRWEVDSLGSAAGAITATSWVDTGSLTRPLEKVGAPVLEERASRLGVAFPASSGSWFTSTRVTPEGATYLVAIDGVTSTGRQMFSAAGFAVQVEDAYWGLRFNGTQIARTFSIAKTANVPVIIGFTTTPQGLGNLFGQDPNGQQGPWPYTGNVPTGAGVQIGANVSVPIFGARMWGEPLSNQDVLDAMATMWTDIFGNA